MNLENFKIEELGFSLAYVLKFSPEEKILKIGMDGTPYKNVILEITNWSCLEILPENRNEILNSLYRICEIRGGTGEKHFYLKGLCKGTVECRIEDPEISLIYEDRLDDLFEAVKEGNISIIKQLIADGTDLNHPRMVGIPSIMSGDYIYTSYALIEAAKIGNFEVTKLLVDHGANVNVQGTSDGETPLICAFYSRDAEKTDPIVRYLVDCGADINAVGGWCESALTQALNYNNQEMVKFLVSHGADVNIEVNIDENETRSRPLHQAIFHKKAAMVELLISLGANLDLIDSCGDTPLHTAVWENNREVCSVLLKAGANINQTDYNGETPLQTALRNDNAEMAEFLKKHGAV
jgi:hypothetical protein